MRHRHQGRKLNRSTKHRRALYKNLLSALIQHGEIQTTLAKAKAIKSLMDKLITTAKKGTLHHRRQLASFFGKHEPANKLVESIAPALKDRTSGYTRIVRLGQRQGDDAMLAKLELVSQTPKKVTSSTKNPPQTPTKSKSKLASKKTPPAPSTPTPEMPMPKSQAPISAPSQASTQKRGER